MWHTHSCLCGQCKGTNRLNLRVPHPSRFMRRVGSYDLTRLCLQPLFFSAQRTLRLSDLCVKSFFSFVFRFSNFQFRFSNSRRHCIISLQRVLNRLRRYRPLAPDAPVLPAQFHNRRGHQLPRLSRIQYQRNPIPQLQQHLFRARASTRPRKIRASPRQRHTELFNQAANNLILRPAQRNPSRIRRHLQRQSIRSLHHHSQRPRPASLRQPVKIRRQISRERPCLRQRIDQDRQRPRFRPPLHAKNFLHGRQIHGIRRQRVQRISRNRHHRATTQPRRSITYRSSIGVLRVDFQHFGRQWLNSILFGKVRLIVHARPLDALGSRSHRTLPHAAYPRNDTRHVATGSTDFSLYFSISRYSTIQMNLRVPHLSRRLR